MYLKLNNLNDSMKPYFRALFLVLLFVTSSCDKDAPVRFSYSVGAEGGETGYDVNLAVETMSVEFGPSSYYFEKTETHYGCWIMDTEWLSSTYYSTGSWVSFRVDRNDTGRARKAVVSGFHRVSGRKYVFEIEQSE